MPKNGSLIDNNVEDQVLKHTHVVMELQLMCNMNMYIIIIGFVFMLLINDKK